MFAGILAILVCILIAGFFSGSETGAYCLNRVRLRHQAESGSVVARMLQQTVANMERFLCLTLIGTNASVYGATCLFTTILTAHLNLSRLAGLAAAMILAPILLISADLLPKSIFNALPNRIMRWTGPPLWCAMILCWPLVMALYGLVSFSRRWFGGERASRKIIASAGHLNFLLTEGRQEGVITPQQDLMVRNIMQMAKHPLRRAMTPLGETQMIRGDAGGAAAVDVIARHDHARLPVYHESRDNVVGILLTLDYLGSGAAALVSEVMRKPACLAEDLRIDHAFRKMQDEGETMTIVVDERQRAIGIVTIGDLLQEIFGSLESG